MQPIGFFIFFISCTFITPSYGANFIQPEQIHFHKSSHTVLLFLSNTCPCSKSHTPHLMDLAKNFPNVSFYGVITEKYRSATSPEALAYFRNLKFPFPVVLDPKQTLVRKFRALKTPHAVILEGRKKAQQLTPLYEGGLSDHRLFQKSKKRFLEKNLLAIRDNKAFPFRFGKSLGCYIRRGI